MAFEKKGDQTYIFGFDGAGSISGSTGLKPQTLTVSYEAEFTAEAQNENGEVVAMAIGPDKGTFTLAGYVVNASAVLDCKEFTFDGKKYIVTSRKIDKSNTEFQKGELSGVSYSGIP